MPFAAERPALGCARLRETPADFVVDERLVDGLAGTATDNEHLLLRIGHSMLGTAAVQRLLAGLFEVPPVDIGFAGRKDRIAVVTQWFTVRLPGRAMAAAGKPDELARRLGEVGLSLLDTALAPRRLRPGMHAGNGFRIALRPVDDAALPLACAERRLAGLVADGVANFFGPQRFDHDRVRAAIDGDVAPVAPRRTRPRRGRSGGPGRGATDGDWMTVSAVRSWLFNAALSMRLAAADWRSPRPEDVMLAVQGPDGREVLVPSGPLWGRGRLPPGLDDLEGRIGGSWPNLCRWLEHVGVQQDRRAVVLFPRDPQVRPLADGGIELGFELEPGGYATSVLRELFETVHREHRD